MVEDQVAAVDRLRRALLTFQGGQGLLLKAHRQMKGLPAGEVEAFWAGPGARLERHVRGTAVELVEAFRVFSKAGLVANAEDRHRVTEAQR
ncbi:hypothetical protein [Belnapia sp. F-4-1]|uniref:hypothetical protein n=1 Tax=Belnapia sp. F-4-1 TaxID=1545443 RepID=UPI0005B9CCBB|nr:hypothetical protein [Belnapia sp. F-4-1]